MSLHVRKVRLGDIYGNLIHGLRNNTFKYNILRTEVRKRNILQGTREAYIDNAFLGNLPSFLAFGIVSNDALSGSFDHNPYYFHHTNINYCCVQLNSLQYPLVPLEPNFKLKQYATAYQHFLINSKKYYGSDGSNVSYSDYLNGCTLFCFDLTADQNFGLEYLNLSKNGNIRIVLKFSEEIKSPSILVLLAGYQSCIEIDKSESVILDY